MAKAKEIMGKAIGIINSSDFPKEQILQKINTLRKQLKKKK
jgi:hypothetical protein